MDLYKQFDHLFQVKLDSWTVMRKEWHDLFDKPAMDTLLNAEQSFSSADRVTVLLAFENSYASLGGLAPVMKQLPKHLRKTGEKVLFISPFHAGHHAVKSAHRAGHFKKMFAALPFCQSNFTSSVTCYKDKSAEFPTYYLQIPDRFFAGDNPYSYTDPTELLIDTLVFCAAVPAVLKKLGYSSNVLFHAHDWETLPIAISSKIAVVNNVLENSRTVLTLHNSFDSGIPLKIKKLFFGKNFGGSTIMQCALPFLNGPITTVSTPFAFELRKDPLQKTVFADHLQNYFTKNTPLGVENGLFCTCPAPFSPQVMRQAKSGSFASLIASKNQSRTDFLKSLAEVNDPRIIGSFHNDPKAPPVPVFYMAGRLDMMQKGFDVMVHAFLRLKKGSAKLVFCPSSTSGSTGKNDDLTFFTNAAKRREGDFIVLPYKIPRTQYDLFLKGASYLLMPSFYEPFGSANEALMNGTPVIARATGGLFVQVASSVPVKIPSFYRPLNLANGSLPNGILYREQCTEKVAAASWRKQLDLTPQKRIKNPLYASMVDAAVIALKQSIALFEDQDAYGSLVMNSIAATQETSWQRAALKYISVYDTAGSRGI